MEKQVTGFSSEKEELEFLRKECALAKHCLGQASSAWAHTRNMLFNLKLSAERALDEIEKLDDAYKPFRVPIERVSGIFSDDEDVRKKAEIEGMAAYKQQIINADWPDGYQQEAN